MSKLTIKTTKQRHHALQEKIMAMKKAFWKVVRNSEVYLKEF